MKKALVKWSLPRGGEWFIDLEQRNLCGHLGGYVKIDGTYVYREHLQVKAQEINFQNIKTYYMIEAKKVKQAYINHPQFRSLLSDLFGEDILDEKEKKEIEQEEEILRLKDELKKYIHD